MNKRTRKVRLPVVTLGIALSLAALFSISFGQSASSQQSGMGQMMMENTQQQGVEAGENAMRGCMMGSSGNQMSGGMMSGMMGSSGDHMACGMMKGMMEQMMGTSGGHMAGGMMGGMSGMHSSDPIAFSDELALNESQVQKIKELQLANSRELIDARATVQKADLDAQAARANPVDLRNLERALRSAADARIQLELLKVRQEAQIGEVLTPAQVEQLAGLQHGSMCAMMSGGAAGAAAGDAVEIDHSAHHPPPVN